MSDMTACMEFFTSAPSWGEVSQQVTSATGSRLHFADGSEALCAISGLWNASLGYGNTTIAKAIYEACLTLSTASLFRRGNTLATQAAEALLEFANPDEYASVLFCTSGGSAVDTAIRLAKQCHTLESSTSQIVLSFLGSYHGTVGDSIDATGQDMLQSLYTSCSRNHMKIDYRNMDGVREALERVGSRLTAVIIEPVLGSGAYTVPRDVINLLCEARDQYGFFLIADEVATGFYRTGPRFATLEWPSTPDLLVLSKALTNGVCATSAVLLGKRVARLLTDTGTVFLHGETQAGSPPACAAILATLQEYERLDVETKAAHLATKMDAFLTSLAESSPRLTTTGRGCLRGVELRDSSGCLEEAGIGMGLVRQAKQLGVIIQPAPHGFQLVPNFLTTDDEWATICDVVTAVVQPWR